jgi:hypothetical protein
MRANDAHVYQGYMPTASNALRESRLAKIPCWVTGSEDEVLRVSSGILEGTLWYGCDFKDYEGMAENLRLAVWYRHFSKYCPTFGAEVGRSFSSVGVAGLPDRPSGLRFGGLLPSSASKYMPGIAAKCSIPAGDVGAYARENPVFISLEWTGVLGAPVPSLRS